MPVFGVEEFIFHFQAIFMYYLLSTFVSIFVNFQIRTIKMKFV